MPPLADGTRLFAVIDQGVGARLILVETLEDAQYLWDKQDFLLRAPEWFVAPVLFVQEN
jgi:hypothetical protein